MSTWPVVLALALAVGAARLWQAPSLTPSLTPSPRRWGDGADGVSPSQQVTPSAGPDPPDGGWHRRAGAVAVAGAAVAAMVGGLPGSLLGLITAAGLWWWLGRLPSQRRVREAAEMAAAVPLCADLLALMCEAGLPLGRACAVLGAATQGPLGAALTDVARRLELGASAQEATQALRASAPLLPLARAVTRSLERGTSPTADLVGVAADGRASSHSAALAHARGLGTRAALPMGLCHLPAFLAVTVVPLVAASLGSMLPGLLGP
jgi:Flp pilus assembly protein TadB